MCSRKVAICVYLGTNQVNRRSFPPPLTFLCNTWTQWTSSKFIGPCDHPHHFHRLSFLPARVPSPTWFLFGFAFFFSPSSSRYHLLYWLAWEFNRSDHVKLNPIDELGQSAVIKWFRMVQKNDKYFSLLVLKGDASICRMLFTAL